MEEIIEYYYFVLNKSRAIKFDAKKNIDGESNTTKHNKALILEEGKKINFPVEYEDFFHGRFIQDYRKFDLNYIRERDPGFELNPRLLNDIERTTDEMMNYFFNLFYFRLELEIYLFYNEFNFKEDFPIFKLTQNFKNEAYTLAKKIDEIAIHLIYNTIN
jgi:hypothetical protein